MIDKKPTSNKETIDILMSYINMTREEDIKFISKCINGEIKYSDSELALSLAMMCLYNQ